MTFAPKSINRCGVVIAHFLLLRVVSNASSDMCLFCQLMLRLDCQDCDCEFEVGHTLQVPHQILKGSSNLISFSYDCLHQVVDSLPDNQDTLVDIFRPLPQSMFLSLMRVEGGILLWIEIWRNISAKESAPGVRFGVDSCTYLLKPCIAATAADLSGESL